MPRRPAHVGPSALVLFGLAIASVAAAYRAPEPGTQLPEFDARLDPATRAASAALFAGGAKPADLVAGPTVEPGTERLAAVAALEREAGSTLTVRWSPVTGSPQMLFARAGFLSAPDGRSADVIARDFVLRHRALWELRADEVEKLEISSRVPIAGGGSVVWMHQSLDGIEIIHGHLGVGIAADGSVTEVSGGDVVGGAALASRVPRHSPIEAMQAIAEAVGRPLAGPPEATAATSDGATFRLAEFRDVPVQLRLVVTPTAWGPHLAWMTHLALSKSAASYEVAVDDATLHVLRRASTTYYADTRGRVFANNPDASPHAIERFPDGTTFRSGESPAGWSAVDLTEGNNTVVRDDIAGDDDATLGRQAQAAPPGPFLAFDFPYTANPAVDLNASLTNLFRDINLSHDRFYDLGFDEPSGSYQVNNFGRGGIGGDPVIGDCQDGSGTDNANFAPAPDGQSGRMQMYLWNTGALDGSLDLGVVMHEYTHGVSNRLVGGPDTVACLAGNQGGSMGEGWSDYFAASYLSDPVIGAYVSGDATVGIRMFALDDNPATGKDYRDFCTYNGGGIPDCPPLYCEPHANGEMWSGFLWLVRDAYIAQHGPAGALLADKCILDGLKLTPCNPSMLDARDAIILADRIETGGVHECLIKEAARNRWMGYSARASGGTNNRPIAANDPWPECVRTGALRFDREGLMAAGARPGYGCTDLVTVLVTDGNAGASNIVTITTTGGDQETLTVTRTVDPAVLTASIPTGGGPVAIADGVLEVVDGDTLTAMYDDPDQPLMIMTMADISCSPRLSIDRLHVLNGDCDDDTVAGYPDLPGFIDAGETADLQIDIRNLLPRAIAGEIRVTTTRPDLVTILPSASGIPVSLPAAIGASPAIATLTVRAIGANTIVPTDQADLLVALVAPGFTAVPAASYTLLLGRDYQLVPGTPITNNIESEAAPVGPAFGTGTLNAGSNQWNVVTCNSASGTKAYHDGPTTCSGNYNDAQGDPWLTAPVLNVAGASTAAVRITNVTFQHDVDLGSAGLAAFGIPDVFDAEVVVLAVMNDPATLNVSDPFSILDTALTAYANLPVLGIDSNTTGYVPQAVPVPAGGLAGVDMLQPAYVTWYFLTDFTPSQCPGMPFPLDAQAGGYYLDDVSIEWEKVEIVPSAASCTAATSVYSLPILASPATGLGCAGNAIEIDASRSESVLCGPPAALDYRFLRAGSPVPCFDDSAGTVSRVQDGAGWGTTAVCWDFPTTATTYDVEVRCAASPTVTDARSISVPVLEGSTSITTSAPAFCPGAGAITVDASASALVGCAGNRLFRFSDAASGPLDCDGDTVPDGYTPAATCDVGPSATTMTVVVEMECDAMPGCVISDSVTLPVVGAPAGTVFGLLFVTKSATGCPIGGDVILSWPTTDYVPQTFVTTRCQEPSFGGVVTGYPAPVNANADALTWPHVGAACDGVGAYRGPQGSGYPVPVYFYQYHLRDGCTGLPILPDP